MSLVEQLVAFFSRADTYGHIGSGLILLSMMMNHLKWLRVINFIGASIFAFYGYLIDAYPVLIMDGLIAMASLFYLIRMTFQKDYFTLNDTFKGQEFFLKNFINYYKNDILQFFPVFDFDKVKDPRIYLISRKMMPVGLFVYEVVGGGEFKVHLDYAIPAYRDLKNFKYLARTRKSFWEEQGLTTMVVESDVKKHISYLKKLGFKAMSDKSKVYKVNIHDLKIS